MVFRFQMTFETVFILAPSVAQATDPSKFGLFTKEVVVDPASASSLCSNLARLGFEVAIHCSSEIGLSHLKMSQESLLWFVVKSEIVLQCLTPIH